MTWDKEVMRIEYLRYYVFKGIEKSEDGKRDLTDAAGGSAVCYAVYH